VTNPGVAQLLFSLMTRSGWDRATGLFTVRHAARADEMPMFIRGLHEGLHGGASAEQLELPSFPSLDNLLIFSDYSDRLGPWSASAFLCTPQEAALEHAKRIAELRRVLQVEDGRRFEYKAMRDKKRWRAIQEWLHAFGSLPGLIFVLLVNENVQSAFKSNAATELDQIVETIRREGLGDWDRTTSGRRLLEAALRNLHSVCYLHSQLMTRGGLHWISDNDEIFDGDVRRSSVLTLLPLVAEKYSGRPVEVQLTTESELQGSPLRDFLSIPDLVAGAALQHQRGLDNGSDYATAKDGFILEWFGDVSALQKVALRLTKGAEDGVQWNLYRPYFRFRRV
jgi:hypothetical protein